MRNGFRSALIFCECMWQIFSADLLFGACVDCFGDFYSVIVVLGSKPHMGLHLNTPVEVDGKPPPPLPPAGAETPNPQVINDGLVNEQHGGRVEPIIDYLGVRGFPNAGWGFPVYFSSYLGGY